MRSLGRPVCTNSPLTESLGWSVFYTAHDRRGGDERCPLATAARLWPGMGDHDNARHVERVRVILSVAAVQLTLFSGRV